MENRGKEKRKEAVITDTEGIRPKNHLCEENGSGFRDIIFCYESQKAGPLMQ